MVILVDDGDGARVQVDPEEVGPHPHAALQPVALLDSIQLAVHSVHTHGTCWWGRFQRGVTDTTNAKLSHRDYRWFVHVFLTRALRLLGTDVKICVAQDLPSLVTKTAVRIRHSPIAKTELTRQNRTPTLKGCKKKLIKDTNIQRSIQISPTTLLRFAL